MFEDAGITLQCNAEERSVAASFDQTKVSLLISKVTTLYRSDITLMYHRHRLATIKEDVRDITNEDHSNSTISFGKVLTVCYRLFEAHFLPAHLATTLTTIGVVQAIYPASLMPSVLRAALDLCAWCRWVSFVAMMCLFYRYEDLPSSFKMIIFTPW